MEGLGLWLKENEGWDVGEPIQLDETPKNKSFTSPARL